MNVYERNKMKRAYLLGEEWGKGLKLADVPFVEGKQKLFDPFVRCTV